MTKSRKYDDRTKHQDRAVTILEKGNHKFSNKTILKENTTSVSNNHDSLERSHSDGNGGHWIKTDADCKYQFSLHTQNAIIVCRIIKLNWDSKKQL